MAKKATVKKRNARPNKQHDLRAESLKRMAKDATARSEAYQKAGGDCYTTVALVLTNVAAILKDEARKKFR